MRWGRAHHRNIQSDSPCLTRLIRGTFHLWLLRCARSAHQARKKTVQLRTTGGAGTRAAVSALWGPKALDPLVDLDLSFIVAEDKTAAKRLRAAQVRAASGYALAHLEMAGRADARIQGSRG
jgi:hypothetical protein